MPGLRFGGAQLIVIVAMIRRQRHGFFQSVNGRIGLLGQPERHPQVIPGLRHARVELRSSLEMRDGIPIPVGGRQQKADFILVSGGCGNQFRQLFVCGQRAAGIPRGKPLASGGLKLRNSGGHLGRQRKRDA
jgi:hypothetical protein